MNVIQLLPEIHRVNLLEIPPGEAQQRLQVWHKQVEEEWIDFLAWWQRCQGKAFTYALLCESQDSDDLRLAWGLELLTRGEALFRRDGNTWIPLDEQRILNNASLAHHLALVRTGAGTLVQLNGKRGVLTGRSNWRLFEVRWQEGEHAGELTCVRGSNLQLI